jgi:hypothetical protein
VLVSAVPQLAGSSHGNGRVGVMSGRSFKYSDAPHDPPGSALCNTAASLPDRLQVDNRGPGGLPGPDQGVTLTANRQA